MAAYRRIKYRLDLTGYGLTFLYLILLVAGGSRGLMALTGSAVLYVGALCLGRGLLQLVVDYARYRHDRRFGVSHLTAGAWLGGHLPMFVLGLVLQGGLALLCLLLWRVAPATWHVWVAAVAVAVVVLVSIGAPAVMGWLTESTPLPDGDLKARLMALAAKTGFPVAGVYVANANPDEKTAGGYVSGYGAARRITLMAETMEVCTPDEIEAIMGHELGHYVYHHVLVLSLLMAGLTALALLAAGFALEPLSVGLGLGGLAAEALPLFALLMGGLFVVLWPLRWAIVRKCERDCDAYALRLTGNAEAFIGCLRKSVGSGWDAPEPPRWVYWYRYRHPTLRERIAAAERFARGA